MALLKGCKAWFTSLGVQTIIPLVLSNLAQPLFITVYSNKFYARFN